MTHLFSQAEYLSSYDKLSSLIEVENAFRHAVFIVENTFDPNITYEQFQNEITLLLDIAKVREKHDSLIYTGKDYKLVRVYGSIFKALTDTTKLLLAGEKYIPAFSDRCLMYI